MEFTILGTVVAAVSVSAPSQRRLSVTHPRWDLRNTQNFLQRQSGRRRCTGGGER